MLSLAQTTTRRFVATLASIAALGVLTLGCFEMRYHAPAPIESDASPAAPYVEELWALDFQTPQVERTLDDAHRLVVEPDAIRVMRGDDTVMELRRCSPRLFDIDGDYPMAASWSADSKAVLIHTAPFHDPTDRYDLGEGCGLGPSRLVFVLEARDFWHVPPFDGLRSEALKVAGSESDFRALPALEFLGRLAPSEAEALVEPWARADPGRRVFLERAIFAGYLCSEPEPLAERLLSNDELPTELRSVLLTRVLQRFSQTDGPRCLRLPRVVDALEAAGDADPAFARQLVESTAGVGGYEAARIRRRLDPPDAELPPRPPPDRLLTADARVAIGEDEIRWIRQALRRQAFPTTTRALRELIGVPVELLPPRTSQLREIYPKTVRQLASGYWLHTFYRDPDHVELAEVLGNGPTAEQDPIERAQAFPSRAEALAALVEDGADADADLVSCDGIFEGLVAGGLECLQPTPFSAILLHTTESGVFGAARRTYAQAIDTLDVESQKIQLVTNRFPRVGLVLLAETGGVSWPLRLDGDIGFGSGELRLVDGVIEVRFRDEVVARRTPDSLTLRHADGGIDCASAQTPTSPILLRELQRDETDFCTRLAAAAVGRLDADVIQDAVRSEDWTIRRVGLVASLRHETPLADVDEAMSGLSVAEARSIIDRLCVETMELKTDRLDSGIAWIRQLADEVDLELPRGCF